MNVFMMADSVPRVKARVFGGESCPLNCAAGLGYVGARMKPDPL